MASRISKRRESYRTQEPPSLQRWQLQAAKAQFSEVFRRARERAPQVVTKQGKEAVVILAIEDYERLTKRAMQPKSLSKFFAESPLAKVSIDLERKPDYGRAVEL
jgi:antitoxin Phd